MGCERLRQIRERLCPSDPTYSAEPLEIEDARWLLDALDSEVRLAHTLGQMTQELKAEVERLAAQRRQTETHEDDHTRVDPPDG
jgi:hypothetical protein